MSKLQGLVNLFVKKDNNNIAIKDIKRLDDGDLSHIGDAILKGEQIEYHNVYYNEKRDVNLRTSYFGQNADYYSVKEIKFYVGDEPLNQQPIKAKDYKDILGAYYFTGGAILTVPRYDTSLAKGLLQRGTPCFEKYSGCFEYLNKLTRLGEYK